MYSNAAKLTLMFIVKSLKGKYLACWLTDDAMESEKQEIHLQIG